MVVGATANSPCSSNRAVIWRGTAPEERVRIEEGDLPQVVGDGVVDPAFQPPTAHRELFAAFPDLKGTEVQGGPVAGTGRVVSQTHLELGRRLLRAGDTAGSGTSSRIARPASAGSIGKRRQVREDDVRLPEDLARVGVLRPRGNSRLSRSKDVGSVGTARPSSAEIGWPIPTEAAPID